MAAFIYRCPVTGYNVQAFVADDLIVLQKPKGRSRGRPFFWRALPAR